MAGSASTAISACLKFVRKSIMQYTVNVIYVCQDVKLSNGKVAGKTARKFSRQLYVKLIQTQWAVQPACN
jgi:hypothetical protein